MRNLRNKASDLVRIDQFDHLETLKRCRGYYKRKPGGPLVGYAGTYDHPNGEKKKWVGEVYYNFARAEQYPHVLNHFGKILGECLFNWSVYHKCGDFNVLLGAPMGGILFAGKVAEFCNERGIYAEKHMTKGMVLDRHQLDCGDEVVLVEDVVNNFSTTGMINQLVKEASAKIVAIACFLNRSQEEYYTTPDGQKIPIFRVLHIPTLQYKQDDPYVADDIASGNIIWKPKDEWEKLNV